MRQARGAEVALEAGVGYATQLSSVAPLESYTNDEMLHILTFPPSLFGLHVHRVFAVHAGDALKIARVDK